MAVTSAVILAAGKGTRMKSDLVKVLHKIAGRQMLAWALAAARDAGSCRTVIVAGHQAEQVSQQFAGDPDVCIAIQDEQLGTGHAVSCSLPQLEGLSGSTLVLCGDTPLLTGDTLRRLVNEHISSSAAVTVLTARLEKPFGYGRIIRDTEGRVRRIVEQKDATSEEQAINEVNSGIYCMKLDFLREHVGNLGSENVQNEYYITDLVGIAVAEHAGCTALIADFSEEIYGVNDRTQLAQAERVLRNRINRNLMFSGVTLVDPEHSYIDAGVRIGIDTTIWPGCVISGNTVIGSGCKIESNSMITDCQIDNHVHIKSASVLTESHVGENATVGPMAHLRPGSVLGSSVKIGNFVETKKVIMGEGSKASHLTYLGDAEIGSDVNIGCGTITCNYDGVKKHKTVIGNRVFVGSDVQLVAPVTVGEGSLIAAGTTVTMDVPPDSLAISRTPQVNKAGWCLKKKNND